MTARRPAWLGVTLIAGAIYIVVGLTFGALAGAADAETTRVIWRLAAYVVSAATFVAHITYEHRQFRSAPAALAWHTALAVALGGFGLAVAANIHELRSPAPFRPRLLLALVAWPLLTSIPAFVVAMAVAAGLIVKRRLDER